MLMLRNLARVMMVAGLLLGGVALPQLFLRQRPSTALRIAYLTGAGASDRIGLAVVSGDGVQQRQLLPPVYLLRNITWSADGRWILFDEIVEGEFGIFRIRPNGKDLQRLTPPELPAYLPVVAPDGQWVAFISHGRVVADTAIYRMRPDGREVQLLMQSPRMVSANDLAWSPAGDQLALTAVPRVNSQLFRLTNTAGDPAGITLEQLTDMLGSVDRPQWMPDGDSLVFIVESTISDIYQLKIGDNRLNAVLKNYQARHVRLAPDGRTVVFHATRDGQVDVYRLRLADGQVDNLSGAGWEANLMPEWSRDGEWLAFVAGRDNEAEVYRMRADGSGRQQLSAQPYSAHAPVWSPPVDLGGSPAVWGGGAPALFFLGGLILFYGHRWE